METTTEQRQGGSAAGRGRGGGRRLPARGFRADVEGLRAVAIVAVLVCHAGIPWLGGGFVGVDVFFVISGFLITGLLLGELEEHGSISLPRFYAKRARRILPLAALLLAAVAAVSLLLFSPLRRLDVSGDVVAAGLYVVNWHFAAQSVDYFQQGLEPSPVLHLWSLAVEEQFYLAWPTILLVVGGLARRSGRAARPAVAVAVALAFCGSLALAVVQTAGQPSLAYFSTLDRAWELALGAALALAGPLRLPRRAAAALGWAGLAAIAFAVVDFSESVPFPGLAALVPTLGAAALIAAGTRAGECSWPAPAAALSLRPVRYVGRVSYSWYLWHWPALVFAAAVLGPLSPLAGLAVVLVALAPTVVSHHLVEEPFRHWRGLARFPYKGLALGSCCMATAVAAGLMLVRLEPTWRTVPAAEVKGAPLLNREPRPPRRVTAIRPNPLQAPRDLPGPIAGGCLVGIEGTKSGHCVYGDRHGRRTLALFGDSHAMQHFPELLLIARRNHWRLLVLTKRECTPAEVPILNMAEGGEYSQCDAWRREALRRIEANRGPTAVAISGDAAERPAGARDGAEAVAAMEAGYLATLRRLRRAGARPVVIGDSPEAPTNVPSCVSANMGDLGACAFPERRHRRGFGLSAARRDGAGAIPLAPEICPRGRCRAVIGKVLVYRDNAHLTATYARTLNRWLEPRLKRAIADVASPGPRWE